MPFKAAETEQKCGRTLARLVCNALFLGVLSLATIYTAGVLFQIFVPWERYQKSANRILWNPVFDGSSIVILGDSSFSSCYVNSEDQTLWSRLEMYTRTKVYPGALWAAAPIDILSAARVVAERWPHGTTVFINIIPTRFIRTSLPDDVGGVYQREFQTILYAPDASGIVHKGKNFFYYWVYGKLFLISMRDFAVDSIDAILLGQANKNKEFFLRVWHKDGDLARKRFQKFEHAIVLNAPHKSFDYLKDITTILESKGKRIVFVLTPLNIDLIREYSVKYDAQLIIDKLNEVHEQVQQFLEANEIEYVDLYRLLYSDDFADMLHTNANGDDSMARHITEWMKTN